MKIKDGRFRLAAIMFSCLFAFGSVLFLDIKSVLAAESDIIISEIYPNSDLENEVVENKNEWIELANLSDEDILLTDYTIEDLNIFNKINSPEEYEPVILDAFTIPAQGLLLLEKEKNNFNFTLNNDSEKIVLRKNGNIIEQFSYGTIDEIEQSYPALAKGQSYAFFGTDGWKITTTTTPGEINIFTGAKEEPDEESASSEFLNIVSARAFENGKNVTVTGTVTALPGVLSAQYFYIQDEVSGIQIYSYGKNFPVLALGDSISVSGELSQTNNERRVKISSADKIVILNHTDPIPPEELTISDIDEKTEGTYIKTAGIVTETSGDTFYLSDGQSEIKVVINKTTGIDKPKMKKGDQVEVAGIVSQYKDEYRILPMNQDDVKIVATENQLPRAGSGEFIYFIISLLLSIIWNIFRGARKKLLT